MSSEVPSSLAAALADRYQLQRPLGRGGMATVYLAHDRRHNRPVAVKVLHEELAAYAGTGRFAREIGITARLQHPHILTLIDSDEVALPDGGRAFLYVMPYVEGESLQQRLAREGALPVGEAVRLLREVVDALVYAHRNGIVHRDIKPGNVLLSGGHALVVDFGVARAIQAAAPDERLTGTGIAVGSPAYMAPEQTAGEGVDERSDIYAAGILAFELLTGRPPFAGPAHAVLAAHLTQAPPTVNSVRPEVPAALSAVVARCLAKDPAERFDSAGELLAALDAAVIPPAATRPRRGLAWGAAAAAVLLLVSLGGMLARERQQLALHAESIPLIRQLMASGDLDSAFTLAVRAAVAARGDETLDQLWPHLSYGFAFRSEPAGARVYRASLSDTTRWDYLGTTPTDTIRVPRSMGYFRFERDGYHPRTILAGGVLAGYELEYALGGASLPRLVRLNPRDDPYPDMVYVEGPALAGSRLADFRIARFEVTNREYLAFVQAGGYQRQEYWTDAFLLDGRPLGWEEAMHRFVDTTGLPGPATWQGGAPRSGEEDLPVGGVSWYEAAAYARFMGMQLPTVAHWQAAAVLPAAGYTMAGSNFDATAVRAARTGGGISPWGVHHVAGNVREWCLNDDDRGNRMILGGGWTDHAFRFADDFSQPPFDRSAINGIRLALYPGDDPMLEAAQARWQRTARDYTRERPVSTAEYLRMKTLFDYDPAPLAARVDARDESHPDWIRERVSFSAAYGGARVTAVVFLPKRTEPPFQTVVFFPGSNALFQRSSDEIDGQEFAWLLRNGRAVIYPIYFGTFERQTGTPIVTSATVAYRDAVMAWGQDLRRTLDYAATRADIDSTRVAYFGHSLGGRMGGVMLAIEPRIRTGILLVAGLSSLPSRPEVDPLNYLPHVTVPVLMLNGRFDDVFRYDTSQRPFYELLGTPAAHKVHAVFDDTHAVPATEMIRRSLAWLDEYLGPAASRSR